MAELESLSKEELVEKLSSSVARIEELESKLFNAETNAEQDEMKLQKISAENNSLLGRAMDAEQKMEEATQSKLAIEKQTEELKKKVAEAEQRIAERIKAEGELSFAIKAMEADLAKYKQSSSLVDEERAKAEKNNELRLNVEHAFEELSRQHEELLAQLESHQRRTEKAEAAASAAKAELNVAQEKNDVLEKKVAELEDDKRNLQKELDAMRKGRDEDKNTIVTLEREKKQLEDANELLKRQLRASQEAEEKAKAELEHLKLKSAQWKRGADEAHDLRLRCENLIDLNAQQASDIKALQDALRESRNTIRRMEEEERKRREESVSLKQYLFLKTQLSEAQEKLSSYAEKEKGWLKERQQLLLTIKKLQLQLANKNPSAMRMMEVEVQNQLLLGMLQGNHNSKPSKKTPTRLGAKPIPRKLPPIASDDDGSPTPTKHAEPEVARDRRESPELPAESELSKIPAEVAASKGSENN